MTSWPLWNCCICLYTSGILISQTVQKYPSTSSSSSKHKEIIHMNTLHGCYEVARTYHLLRNFDYDRSNYYYFYYSWTDLPININVLSSLRLRAIFTRYMIHLLRASMRYIDQDVWLNIWHFYMVSNKLDNR